jgi:hypothetical protein
MEDELLILGFSASSKCLLLYKRNKKEREGKNEKEMERRCVEKR